MINKIVSYSIYVILLGLLSLLVFSIFYKKRVDQGLDIARKSSGVVVVDFWSSKCPPSAVDSIFVRDISIDKKDVLFFRIDIDSEVGLRGKYSVEYVPTVIVFSDGKELYRAFGSYKNVDYDNILDSILESKK